MEWLGVFSIINSQIQWSLSLVRCAEGKQISETVSFFVLCNELNSSCCKDSSLHQPVMVLHLIALQTVLYFSLMPLREKKRNFLIPFCTRSALIKKC